MMRSEVTVAQYRTCVTAGCVHGARTSGNYTANLDNHPVNHISWADAKTFATLLTPGCRPKQSGNMLPRVADSRTCISGAAPQPLVILPTTTVVWVQPVRSALTQMEIQRKRLCDMAGNVGSGQKMIGTMVIRGLQTMVQRGSTIRGDQSE